MGWSLLFVAGVTLAGAERYQVESTITIRKASRQSGVLETVTTLKPGVIIRFDENNRVGSMRYRNDSGGVSRSRSGWYRGIEIVSGVGRSQRQRWNRMELYLSTTHTNDIGTPGGRTQRPPRQGRPPRRGHNDKTTEYFTFKARSIDRKICKMEGTMIVGGVLYVWTGGKCRRAGVQCEYGIGNRNNCLTPCKSIAADKKYWRNGQQVYIAKYDGKNCPSTGRRMNGYFEVADVGSRIKGPRRFDIFTGICVSQSGGVCHRHVRR